LKLTKEVQNQLNDLLKKQRTQRGPQTRSWLWPRMNCSVLCGYAGTMARPHLSCLFCRVRRFFYGKMNPKKYHYNSRMRIVFPADQTTYVMLIDNQRRFAALKSQILKRLLTVCEWLAN
jgi:hypothetical protein